MLGICIPKNRELVVNIRTWAILLILFCLPAHAQFENYLSNFTSPIPPACVTNLQVFDDFNFSDSQIISQRVVPWVNTDFQEQDLEITVWQKGCPETGRRVLVIDLELLDNQDGFTNIAQLPQPWGSIPGDLTRYWFRLNVEPNTNMAMDDVTGIVHEGIKTSFILDTYAPLAADFDFDKVMLASQYNAAFQLELDDPDNFTTMVQIPRYHGNLGSFDMTFTGRLSGNWVTPAVPDQGFVLAFEELADESEGLFFLSWYTYDSNGNLLWLTGANTYGLLASQVSFDIELVTNGQFLGAKTADRQVVGSGTISAFNCNDLELTYNLNALGLGSGTILLRRLFSLEIQGYACGDSATRIEHISDGG